MFIRSILLFTSVATLMAQQPTVMGMRPAGGAGNVTFIAGGMISGSPVQGAPYSAQAVTEFTQVLADGNRIVNSSTATVYRDSYGRERREQTLPNIGALLGQGNPTKMILISDPVTGVNYSLDPSSKVAMKLPAMKTSDLPPLPDLPPPPANGQVFFRSFAGPAGGGAAPGPVMYFNPATAGGSSTPSVEQLGSQSINGVSTNGTRTTLTIPAGQIGNENPIGIVDEVWRSANLQVIVQSTHSDPRSGTTTYSLTNISRSEPSATLFQVPADYAVRDAPAPTSRAIIAPAQ
jgi:hypothetical protein